MPRHSKYLSLIKPTFKRRYKKVDRSWISPSHLRNYLLKDGLSDWLSLSHRGPPRISPWTQFLMKKGIDFEQSIIKELQRTFPFVQVSYSKEDIQSYNKFEETLNLLQNGVPLIYQGVLHDQKDRVFGSPDLIIRSDWLNRIVPETLSLEEEKLPSLFSPKFHYRIVEIKFITLHLRSNGINLLNSGNLKYYKSQVIFYNQILGNLQNYTPPECYILGRGYTYTKNGISYGESSAFKKLGVVNVMGLDEDYQGKIEKAKDWIKRLRKNGKKWKIFPVPSVPELYPNMASTNDTYREEKLSIAQELADITLIWQCGVKNREKAFENGVTRWDDKRCSASLLGHKGKIIAPIVDLILKFNRGEIEPRELVIPKKIINNLHNWQTQSKVELYLDIETMSNIFDSFDFIPHIGGISLITLIGVYVIDDRKRYYRYFHLSDLTIQAEEEMMIKFSTWFQQFDNPLIFHWGTCDSSRIELNLLRYNLSLPAFSWVNMLQIFRSEPILVKGVFSFSLKEIAKGMTRHGLIEVAWPEECQSGFSEMILTWNLYQKNKELNIPITHSPHFESILAYNRVDCQAIAEIVKYLRSR